MIMDFLELYIDMCEYLLISMRKAGFKLRPRAGPGLWLIPLVPLAVFVSAALKVFRDNGTISHIYFASAVVGAGLLLSTCIYLLKFLPKRKKHYYFLLPSVMTLLILLVTLNAHSYDYDRANTWFRRPCGLSRSSHIFSAFVLSLSGGILSVYGVYCGVPILFYKAPGCFTPGEAVLVIHAVVLFVFGALVNIVDTGLSQVNYLADMAFSYEVATIILQVGGIAILGFLTILLFSPYTREPPQFFMVLSTAILCTVIALHSLLGGSPILWIFYNIIRDELTFHVFVSWIGLSIAGSAFVFVTMSQGRKASTAQRKMFHVLAVVAFTSGVLWAPDLLYLASGVCFAAFLVLEAARCCQIPPLSEVLRRGFLAFSDEKDSIIALTPLYLLGGMAAPLWLTPLDQIPIAPSKLLPYLAGVFTLGIGDTAASYYGSKFGVMPWPGTSRTIEGTVACFMSQIVSLGPLVYYGFIPADFLYLLRAMGAIGVVSLIEALTDQVDNLVLPLVFYTLTI